MALPNPEPFGSLGADLEAARAGDGAALNRLLVGVRRYLRTIARHEMPEELAAKEDGSDLVQQSLLEITRGLDAFRGRTAGELLRWAQAILLNRLNKTRRYYHAARRDVRMEVPLEGKGSHPGAQGHLVAPDPDPMQVLAGLERNAVLRAGLERLPEPYQTVLRLRHTEQLPFAEIARRLGLAEDAARKRWVRAVARLEREVRPAL